MDGRNINIDIVLNIILICFSFCKLLGIGSGDGLYYYKLDAN
jgi:hypothetical protein